jgi:hypothetical protein
MLNIKFGAGTVGAASRCGSSFTKLLWLVAAPAPQHRLEQINFMLNEKIPQYMEESLRLVYVAVESNNESKLYYHTCLACHF